MTKVRFCKKNRLAVFFLLLGIVLCAAYLWMCHVFGRTPEMRLRRWVFGWKERSDCQCQTVTLNLQTVPDLNTLGIIPI